MDAFYSTSSSSSSSGPYGAAAYGGSGWGYDSLKNFRQISPAVQTHLKLVRPALLLPTTLPSFALLLLSSSSRRACVRFSLVAGVCLNRRFGVVSGIEGRKCGSGFGRPRSCMGAIISRFRWLFCFHKFLGGIFLF
jgi:hypothetical protein